MEGSSRARPAGLVEAIRWLHARITSDGLGGRVSRGAIRTIAVAGSGAAVSYAVQLVLARKLGDDGYGVYLLALGWVGVAQVFGKLDIDLVTVRFVASYASTHRWNLLRGVLQAGRKAVLTASGIVALLGAALILLLSDRLEAKHPNYAAALLAACALLPALSLLMVEGAALQGLQKYARSQLPLVVIRPVALAVTVGLVAVVFGVRLTPPMAVGANLTAVVVALAFAGFWRARATPAEVHAAAPAWDYGLWSRTAAPLVAVSMGQLIVSQQADVLIVGVYLDTAEAGIYGAASQLSLPLGLALASVTYVAQPIVSDLYAKRDLTRLQSLIRVVTWGSGALALPIATALILLGPWLLGLYGAAFKGGYSILVILTFSQVVQGIGGHLAGYMLTMTEHERTAAMITGFSAVLNAVLALVLTPIYGPVGTASATLTTAITRAIILRYYIRRTLGLRMPAI